MRTRLLLQPFSPDKRVGVALAGRSRTATNLWLLSAWAHDSGIKHLAPVVDQLRSRGGTAEAILGVDQGIATAEGLRSALATFDVVYLFHDGRRTFHPKLYAIESHRETRLIIGSSNVTQGGLFDNFEASVELDLQRSNRDDERIRTQARRYFDGFLGTGMPFRKLDGALIKELRDEGLVVPTSERTTAENRRRRRSEPPLRRIFGGSVRGLPPPPSLSRASRSAPTKTGGSGRARGARGATAALGGGSLPSAGTAASTVVMSWWRQLSVSDAMKKDSDSHQRKNVILNRGPHPIDQTVFFRNHFFQGVPWSHQMMRSHRGNPPRPKEVAVVPFDVTIGRRHLGIHNLQVDHAASRIANQGNSPTWLNWSSLGAEIARGNYVHRYLVLERLANGTFRLTIQRAQPAPAVVPSYARR